MHIHKLYILYIIISQLFVANNLFYREILYIQYILYILYSVYKMFLKFWIVFRHRISKIVVLSEVMS